MMLEDKNMIFRGMFGKRPHNGFNEMSNALVSMFSKRTVPAHLAVYGNLKRYEKETVCMFIQQMFQQILFCDMGFQPA